MRDLFQQRIVMLDQHIAVFLLCFLLPAAVALVWRRR